MAKSIGLKKVFNFVCSRQKCWRFSFVGSVVGRSMYRGLLL